MRRAMVAGALAFGAVLQSGAVLAATLSFDEVLQSSAGGLLSGPAGREVALEGATLSVTSPTGTIFIYNSADYGAPVQDGGAFCAVIGDGTFGDRCTGGASIVFLRPVEEISFSAVYVGPGDAATVTAYAGSSPLASVAIAAVGEILGFRGLSGITRLDFADASTVGSDIVLGERTVRVGTGIAYTGFEFTVMPDPPVLVPEPPAAVQPIPLPAAGGLLAGALAALALLRRRQARSGTIA